MKLKKLLSIILAVIMVLGVCPLINASAEEATERTVIDSGFCGAQGDNLTWTLYDDGELVISGEGETPFYYITEACIEKSSPLIPPWFDYSDDIRVITVEEGVTGIGYDAFALYPRMYHRVNLPKSLEYYYFGSFAAEHPDRITLACSYAGTRSEWGKVERRGVTGFSINEDYTEVINIKHRNPTYGWGISDNATDDMYYNGEEPEIYCEIVVHTDEITYSSQLEKGDTREFHVRYYPGEHSDAEIVWRTVGDSCTLENTKYSPSGVPTYAQITSVTHGEFTVIAELVAPDGTVLSSDSEDLFSYVREDMTFKEKIVEFFRGMFGTASFYLYMINLLGMLFGMSFFG